MNIDATIEFIVGSPELHAPWLNTISYLEYRGFRKIARSQKTEDIDLEKLIHAAEEVRHAIFFKRLAIKIGGASFAGYKEDSMLGGFAAKKYFYDLDAGVSEFIKDLKSDQVSAAAYCIITWLIEQRALMIYALYEKHLCQKGSAFSVGPILNEETNHLKEMVAAATDIILANKTSIESLHLIEEMAFERLWGCVESAIGLAKNPIGSLRGQKADVPERIAAL